MYAAVGPSVANKPLLLCLSHLRWDFVFQRPQHLLSLAVSHYQVLYIEEPLASLPDASPSLDRRTTPEGVMVATPRLPQGLDPSEIDAAQRYLLDDLLGELALPLAVAWYYTPMAAAFAGHLHPEVTVFDVMDELSAFHGASPRLALLERRLLKHADLVFTGGRSLHEAKRRLHPSIHLFPSSVDAAHYRCARGGVSADPPDQACLPHPRIGYFGVIDERIDYALLDGVAAARPDWQFVMVGPTAKIDPAGLPRRPNLHWLGRKDYAELPGYLAGWDAGLMPFALNEATRFISPTKTPEFLAAGVPVVSTPIPDVVSDWGSSDRGRDGLVTIAGDVPSFVAALQRLLGSAGDRAAWLERADQQLSRMSWQMTWAGMRDLIEDAQTDPVLAVATPEGSLVR